MKKQGNFVTGDPVRLDKFTGSWATVKLHPAVFYRRIDQFHDSLNSVRGLYTEIDTGECVMIRFSEKDDLAAFYKTHNQYV
jgi:hypothetical protein